LNNEFKDTMLFSGFAKVPQDAPFYNEKQEVTCLIEVDMVSKTIVNCQFGQLQVLTNDFLVRMIVGYDLSKGIDLLVKEINRRFHLSKRNAIIKSIEVCYQKYFDFSQRYVNIHKK
jgi:hypothetical protein